MTNSKIEQVEEELGVLMRMVKEFTIEGQMKNILITRIAMIQGLLTESQTEGWEVRAMQDGF